MLGTCGRSLQQLQLGLESGEEKGLLGAWIPGSMGHPHQKSQQSGQRGLA